MMTEWHFVMMLVTWRPEESDSDRDKARSGPRTSPCPHNGPRSDSAMPALHQDTLASTRAQRNPPPLIGCRTPVEASDWPVSRQDQLQCSLSLGHWTLSPDQTLTNIFPLDPNLVALSILCCQRQISTFQCLLNSLLFKAQRLSLMNKIEPLICLFVNLLLTDSVNHFVLPARTVMY